MLKCIVEPLNSINRVPTTSLFLSVGTINLYSLQLYIILFLQRPSLDVLLGKKYPHLVNSNLEHSFYFVHRLDFVTSGVLCIALNKRACAKASGAMQKRISRKYYIALVRGHVSEDHLDMTDSIGNKLYNDIYVIHLYLILYYTPFWLILWNIGIIATNQHFK